MKKQKQNLKNKQKKEKENKILTTCITQTKHRNVYLAGTEDVEHTTFKHNKFKQTSCTAIRFYVPSTNRHNIDMAYNLSIIDMVYNLRTEIISQKFLYEKVKGQGHRTSET